MRPPLRLGHRLPGPAVAATVLARENRFLARCRLGDGREVHAHVPDRGRLSTILVPGARAWLYPSNNPARRTGMSLLVCEEPATGVLVAIDPAGANLRVRALLERGLVPGVARGVDVRAEVTVGASRLDFLLRDGPRSLALEVKSVGVTRGGVARFPDAPTARGVRHLHELAAFAREGRGDAMLLFVVQRGDAKAVGVDEERDPLFAATLRELASTLRLAAVGFEVSPAGLTFQGELPIVL